MPIRTMFIAIVSIGLAGCAFENNPNPTAAESDCLSNIIQLTTTFDGAGEAYFSRDMRWMVFQAFPRGKTQYQMYVAPVRYKQVPASSAGEVVNVAPLPATVDVISGIGLPIRISPENSRNTCGNFSPDGLSLIFASTAGKEDPNEPNSGYQRSGRQYRWSFPAGMEIYRADGWQGAVAAAEPGRIVDLAQHRLTDNQAYDAECAYSPDGKWIVFTSNRTGDLELWAMRADGSNPVQLTHAPGYDGGPFFSPDGKRVVYRSDRQKNDLLQVFVADLAFDGQGNITGIAHEKQLTHDSLVNWGPYWHPDGQHIIWGRSGKDPGNYDLWLMRSDGSLKTRVTYGGLNILPVFSPDGKYLMWTSRRNGQSAQIYIANFRIPPHT